MKRKAFLLAVLSILGIASAFAQDEYGLEVKTNKKVIHVDQLGLPGNMSIIKALDILPELLGREAVDILANYQINLDDKSIGVGRDVVLLQIHLCDVEKIEISQNPSASQQKNGQGGVVGIFLKPQQEDGFGGQALLDMSTEVDLMPNVQLAYKKGPWRLLGMTMLEYHHPLNTVSNVIKDYPFRKENSRIFQNDTTVMRYGAQNARFYANYRPDNDNELKIWLTENLAFQKNLNSSTSYESLPVSTYEEQRNNGFSMETSAEYEHYFPKRNSIDIELTYYFKPQYSYSNLIDPPIEGRVHNHEVTLGAKYTQPIRMTNPDNSLKLKWGVNSSGSFAKDVSDNGLSDISDSDSRTFYISPYVEAEAVFGPVNAKASLRYQHYRYNELEFDDNPFTKSIKELTGGLDMCWQVKDHHNLRLELAKNIVRPTGEQMYPSLCFSPNYGSYVIGNADLTPTRIYSVDVDYITDQHFGEHDMVVNVGLGYSLTKNIINVIEMGDKSPADFGMMLRYKTFANKDVLRSFKFNLMAFYKYEQFSIAFAGNAFSNFEKFGDPRSRYGYFNLSISPAFALLQNWTLSAKGIYTSRVLNLDGHLGDAFNLQFRVSKVMKDWDFHFEFHDIFHNHSEDVIYGSEVITTKLYHLYKNYFNIGATLVF